MSSLLCRIKDKFQYLVASPETSAEILDKIGFGANKCKETHEKDQRYGYSDEHMIYYGFGNRTRGTISFGHYVIFDFWFDDCNGYTVCDENEFKEDFEECE